MRLCKNKKGLWAHVVSMSSALVLLSPMAFTADTEEQMPGPGPAAVNPLQENRPMPRPPQFMPESRPAPSAADPGMRNPLRDGRPMPKQPSPFMRDAGSMPKPPSPFMRDGRPMPKPPTRGIREGRSAASPVDDDIFKVVPQTCKPATGQFVWNFEDEQLINILKQVSDLLCITIVVNDSINANLKLTIIGKSPMTPKDAWTVLLASLGSKGLALVEQGKTWTVIKRNESKSYNTPFYAAGSEAANNEGIGTLFYKAKHTSLDSLKNVARVLITKDGTVESVGDAYILVIDSNSNIRRLGKIFDEIDVEDAVNKIHIISLAHSDAKTVERQLRELFEISPTNSKGRRRPPAPGGPERTPMSIDKIIADERMNSLIIVADKDSIKEVENVVRLIDQPISDKATKGNIHVRKLRYADAKEVAETLNNAVGQGRARGNRFGRKRPDEEGGGIFEGEIKVTAHQDTGMLVIVATPTDYNSLLSIINSLDVRKEQVYVEAAILHIAVTDNNKFGLGLFSGIQPTGLGLGGSLGLMANPGGQAIASGISTALAKDTGGSLDVGGLGQKSIGALAVLGNFLSGGVVGLVGKPADGTSVPTFGAVLTALSETASIDVLSTPYLLTTDNKEAVMSVGEKIPVIKGASTVGGGAMGAGLGVPLQNVSYEDVKLTFKITPHVGAESNIRMDIEQEVNELGAQVEILGQAQHRINTKSVKSTIILEDQQTGVIGGLISHSSTTTDQKTPLLGDIPLLGWLFKSRKSDQTHKSLLLVMTPYIIRSNEDYKKILERKLKEREEFAKLYYGGKIKDYNKYIDYDKKAGPLASMIHAMDIEMQKVENDGPGVGNETIISPQQNNESAPPAATPAAPLVPEAPAGPIAPIEPSKDLEQNKPAITDETTMFLESDSFENEDMFDAEAQANNVSLEGAAHDAKNMPAAAIEAE